jgi:hypothetical protein
MGSREHTAQLTKAGCKGQPAAEASVQPREVAVQANS